MEAIEAKQPVNILLVDDQPAKLLSYETILGELGENLIRASSGNEALGHLRVGADHSGDPARQGFRLRRPVSQERGAAEAQS
jgi:CheY-like chemotaxis protein